jgi:predicted NBD/HSP70 family sugar kinase
MSRTITRKHNLRNIIEILKREGPMTQTVLKEHVNLQASTVSYLVNDLRSFDIVIDSGETIQGSGPGKPGNLIQLNNGLAQFIGVYVEDNQINLYVIGLDGETINFQKEKIEYPSEVEQVLVAMVQAKREEYSNIRGIGIAMKAMVLFDDTIRFGFRKGMPEQWELHGLKQRLQEYFEGIPIIVENDASCTADLYQYHEKEDNMNLILYLLNRTPFGIGCAILVNGELVKGAKGAAGQYYYKDSELLKYITSTDDGGNLANIIEGLMPHIATTAYLFDPKKVVLSGSFLNGVNQETSNKVMSIIDSYQLPFQVILTKGNIELDPAKGAALIAINNFISDFIAKVGAR